VIDKHIETVHHSCCSLKSDSYIVYGTLLSTNRFHALMLAINDNLLNLNK